MSAVEILKPLDMVAIRQAGDGDLNFFYRTLLDNYFHAAKLAYQMPARTFFEGHRAVLSNILARATARLTVACLRDDGDVLVGFALTEGTDSPVLHYVYTKGAFRGYGVARLLLEAAGITAAKSFAYTHSTREWQDARASFPPSTYNPYLR